MALVYLLSVLLLTPVFYTYHTFTCIRCVCILNHATRYYLITFRCVVVITVLFMRTGENRIMYPTGIICCNYTLRVCALPVGLIPFM